MAVIFIIPENAIHKVRLQKAISYRLVITIIKDKNKNKYFVNFFEKRKLFVKLSFDCLYYQL